MKYIDIFTEAYRLEKIAIRDAFYKQLTPQVLAWSANHEHAVFGLHSEVHPATVCVWFQYRRETGDGWEDVILKIKHNSERWKSIEEPSVGRIPYVNNNPFDPSKNNAASNTAESVFPQNYEEN